MNRFILATIATLCSFLFMATAYAQSTIYVFSPSLGGGEPTTVNLKINGQDTGTMLGSIKKTIKPYANLLVPFHTYHPTVKKCVVNNEGKILISIEGLVTNATNPSKKNPHAAELQLDVEDGETYYVQFKRKGFSDCQIVELDAKEGQKLLNKNKYENLPDYVEAE